MHFAKETETETDPYRPGLINKMDNTSNNETEGKSQYSDFIEPNSNTTNESDF